MRLQRNYYEILGVPRTATPQEIKHKYHDLARQYHPDRATDKDLAQRLFVQINRAYGTLMNPEKRALYDASLFTGAASSSAGGAPSATMTRSSESASAPTNPRPGTAPLSGARNGVAPGPPPSAPQQPVTPQQIKQWLDEANLAQMRGNMDGAKRFCQNVIDADPRNFPGLVLMGDLLAQQGRQDDALVQYRTAIAIQPTNRVLREKIARLEAILARKAAAMASSSNAASAISSHIPPPAGDAPAPKKSLIDRIMNRGK